MNATLLRSYDVIRKVSLCKASNWWRQWILDLDFLLPNGPLRPGIRCFHSRDMNEQRASKERRNALNMFLRYLPTREKFELPGNNMSIHRPLLPSNFIAFSSVPFQGNIPREKGWAWCQSDSRNTVAVDNLVISFKKMNARKKKLSTNSIKPPTLKIWLFESKIHDEQVYCLWSEKGVGRWQGVVTTLGIIYPQMLMMEDFEFLASFMDENIARALGLHK